MQQLNNPLPPPVLYFLTPEISVIATYSESRNCSIYS